MSISNDYQCRKTEPPAALDNLGITEHLYNSIFQWILFVYSQGRGSFRYCRFRLSSLGRLFDYPFLSWLGCRPTGNGSSQPKAGTISMRINQRS